MIRDMVEADIPVVSKLYKSANPHSNEIDIAKWTASNLKLADGVYLVLEKDGIIIGGISSYIKGDTGFIDDIAIDDKHRQKGHGAKLMKECINQLISKGAKNIHLEVHYKCSSAIPFYYSHGFKMTEIKKDGFGKDQDLIKMEKTKE